MIRVEEVLININAFIGLQKIFKSAEIDNRPLSIGSRTRHAHKKIKVCLNNPPDIHCDDFIKSCNISLQILKCRC